MTVPRMFTLLAVTSLAGAGISCGGSTESPANPPSDPATSSSTGELRAVGAACAFDAQCASGGCTASQQVGSCGYCYEVALLGERCDGVRIGCSRSAVCRDGSCQTTMQPLFDRCSIGGKRLSVGCDDDLYCLPDAADPSWGVCVPGPGLGEGCSSTERCAGRVDCERGICVARRLGAEGDSCNSRRCASGLTCRYDDKSGATCRTLEQQEPRRRGAGEECALGDCAPGLECRNWRCVAECR